MATAKKAEEAKKVVKATPADTVAKVEAAKAAAKKTTAAKPAVKKPATKAAEAAKAVEAPKTEAKTAEAAKTVEAPKTEVKAAAKKTTAAKPVAKKAAVKTEESVFIEFAGGQIEVAAIISKVKENLGKKSVKTLNVYYQPETNMVYYTADNEAGSFSL